MSAVDSHQTCVLSAFPNHSDLSTQNSFRSDSEGRMKCVQADEKPTGGLKRPRSKPKTSRSKRYSWSPSHYIPNSFAMSKHDLGLGVLHSLSGLKSPIKSKAEKYLKKQPSTERRQSKLHTCQARHILGRLCNLIRRAPTDAKPAKAQPLSRSNTSKVNKKSKNSSKNIKSMISYPMKLPGSELNDLTATQDHRDARARAAGMRRRTMSLASRHPPSSTRTKPTVCSRPAASGGEKRDSIRSRNRVSATTSVKTQKTKETPRLSSPCHSSPLASTERPQSSRHLSRDSYRLSLHHHPPLRNLTLSPQPRRASVSTTCQKVVGEPTEKHRTPKPSSRFTSTASVKTASNSAHRRSHTGPRPVTSSGTSRYSRSSFASENSYRSVSRVERRSIASCRFPAMPNWEGVIEEDVTVTLMGCPRSSVALQRQKRIDASTTTVSTLPLTTAPEPSTPASSISTSSEPSTPSVPQLDIHRRLSLSSMLLGSISDVLEGKRVSGSGPAANSNWYAELMDTLEHI